MSDQVIAGLIKEGVLGTLLAGALLAVIMLYRTLSKERADAAKTLAERNTEYIRTIEQLNAKHLQELQTVQNARIGDAQAYQAQVLELTRASVAAITTATNASLAVKEAVVETRDLMASQNETLREQLETLLRAPSLTKR